jgi:hypothetical protein
MQVVAVVVVVAQETPLAVQAVQVVAEMADMRLVTEAD